MENSKDLEKRKTKEKVWQGKCIFFELRTFLVKIPCQ